MSTSDDTKRRTAATKRPTTRAEDTTSAGRSDHQQPTDVDGKHLYEVDLTNNPVPDPLRKRGITRVFTNKAPDQELMLPPDLISQTFGKTVFERLMARKQAELDEQENPPCAD